MSRSLPMQFRRSGKSRNQRSLVRALTKDEVSHKLWLSKQNPAYAEDTIGTLAQPIRRDSLQAQPVQLGFNALALNLSAVREALNIGAARSQQINEIYSAEDKQRIEKRRAAQSHDLHIALTSTGVAFVGLLAAPPLALLSVPGTLYALRKIFVRAFSQLKQGKVGVPAISSITIIGCISFYYIGAASFIGIIMSWSQKLRSDVMEESRGRLINIFKQHPKTVWIQTQDGSEVQLPFEQVAAGQHIIVNAGEIIPIDGRIVTGMATVDQHILTGESQPVEREIGDEVFAMTTVLSGKICVFVEKAGADTAAAQIGRMLNETIEYKASAQLRAETLSDRTVLPTFALAGITWSFLGPIGALAVLQAHFKHKMSVMAPISLMNFLNRMSQKGILIKDGRMLELLNQVDTIVFDKTGTLTHEQPHVGTIYSSDSYSEETILLYAAAAEQKQSHPIAQAILAGADERNLQIPHIADAEYKIGYGLTVTIDEQIVQVGSYRYMEVLELDVPMFLSEAQDSCHESGHSLVLVAIGDEVVGGIELVPTIREDVKEVIATLRENYGITSTYIISGDHEIPTRKLAREIGIDHYFAQTLPEDKAGHIKRLKNEGKFVCYIGDGINDAIALKASHVSISLRGASGLAKDTAQIILIDEKLTNLVSLFNYADAFRSNINTGFVYAVVPSLVGMSAIYLLGFGVLHMLALNAITFVFGIGNSMLPLLQDFDSVDELLASTTSTTTQERPR